MTLRSSFLEPWLSEYRWFRRLAGGKWEQWWADPVNTHVWLDVDDWTPVGKRPGGCAIWAKSPAPQAREKHS